MSSGPYILQSSTELQLPLIHQTVLLQTGLSGDCTYRGRKSRFPFHQVGEQGPSTMTLHPLFGAIIAISSDCTEGEIHHELNHSPEIIDYRTRQLAPATAPGAFRCSRAGIRLAMARHHICKTAAISQRVQEVPLSPRRPNGWNLRRFARRRGHIFQIRNSTYSTFPASDCQPFAP